LNWQDKIVIVTGGAGFLGRHVVAGLLARGLPDSRLIVPRKAQYDLRRWDAVEQLFRAAGLADPKSKIKNPELIIVHLAGNVGGIGYNREHPGELFYDNIMIGVQLMEAARRYGVAKFVAVGTICAYPKFTPVPFHEENLWIGYPEETNAPYGLAKKMLLVQAQAYRQQYGLNAIYLLPVNLYGPWDNFDLTTSHVIPALIRKMEEARRSGAGSVTLWGSGAASREFLYVEDCAEGILLAAERYDAPEPVNLGTGASVTVRDLAIKVATATGFAGRLEWDRSKPDGQPKRQLDTSKARERFGFEAKTSLDEGLSRTVAWFREHFRA